MARIPGPGFGTNMARSRLMLARRAGYLPQNMPIDPEQAPAMWAKLSKNLSRDAQGAGFQHPLMWLRAGAQAGGKLPRRGIPGVQASDPLAYAASRLAQRLAGRPNMLGPLQAGAPSPMNMSGLDEGGGFDPYMGPPRPVAPQAPPMGLAEGGGFQPNMGAPQNPILAMLQRATRPRGLRYFGG